MKVNLNGQTRVMPVFKDHKGVYTHHTRLIFLDFSPDIGPNLRNIPNQLGEFEMKDKNVFRDDLESGIPPCFTAAPWPTEHRAYRILEEFWVENIHIEDPEVQDVTLVRRYLEALFQSGMISESDFILLAEFLDTFYTACWHYHNDGRSKQVSFWNQIVGDKS